MRSTEHEQIQEADLTPRHAEFIKDAQSLLTGTRSTRLSTLNQPKIKVNGILEHRMFDVTADLARGKGIASPARICLTLAIRHLAYAGAANAAQAAVSKWRIYVACKSTSNTAASIRDCLLQSHCFYTIATIAKYSPNRPSREKIMGPLRHRWLVSLAASDVANGTELKNTALEESGKVFQKQPLALIKLALFNTIVN